MPTQKKMQILGIRSEPLSLTDFQTMEIKTDTKSQQKTCTGNEALFKNFNHRVKSAIDKGWPLDPNETQVERENQQSQRNAKLINCTISGLKPNGLK